MPETIFTSLGQFLITCGVLMLAQVVYVVLGFGSGLISVGLLALVYPDIKDVVVVLLLVNLPAEISVVRTSWRLIKWRPVLGLCSGIGIGIVAGAKVLADSDPAVVLTVLGWFLVVVGLVFLRLPPGNRWHPPAIAAPPTGLVSGVLTGLFGTGGPPLIIWYHLSTDSKTVFRGSLMTIFLLMTLVRVPSYAVNGLITVPRLWSTLALLPAVLLGTWIGHHLHIRLSETAFRRIVSGTLAILGVILLLKN